MKQITNKTIIKQGDKTYQPIEVDGVVYWTSKEVLDSGYVFTPNILIEKIICKYPNSSSFMVETTGENSPYYVEFLSQIVAQSQLKLEGVPVISLDNYAKKLATKKGLRIYDYDGHYFMKGYNSNHNQYTQKDIEKAIDLTRKEIKQVVDGVNIIGFTNEQIYEQINSISVIEVDDEFNILSYE
jgi:hypothetical protein